MFMHLTQLLSETVDVDLRCQHLGPSEVVTFHSSRCASEVLATVRRSPTKTMSRKNRKTVSGKSAFGEPA
jgi:hypothetical protein